MVDLVSTQYFLIHTVTTHQSFFFLNSLTNEKGVSNKKNIAKHSSIMIFAYFIYFNFIRSLLAALFKTFH